MRQREIIVIPAKLDTFNGNIKKRKLRVASYCRVSTDSDEQLNSFEAQKVYYTDLILKNKNWSFVRTYADEGLSGASMKKRPEFTRMINHCEKGKIDLIITKSISRFSRNILDSISTIRRLKAKGIGVFFEKENINTLSESSELLLTFLSAISQEELESLSKNVRMGKRMAMKEGKVSFQYKRLYAYQKGADGNPEIIPDEAEVVVRIFRNMIMGLSTRKIAEELNKDGIPAPFGKDWQVGTIRNITKNEVYCGDVILQKTFVTDPISKKVKINNGELPKIYIRDNHDPIVTREMFDAVQLERAKRSGKQRATINNGIILSRYSGKNHLNGLLICGDCGTEYQRKVWTLRNRDKMVVWRCATRLKHGPEYCNTSPTLDEEALYKAIMQSVITTREERDSIIQFSSSELGKTFSQNSDKDVLDISATEKQIEQLTRRTMQYIEDKSINIVDYTETIKSMSAEIARLKALISAHSATKQSVNISDRVTTISHILADEAQTKEWDGVLVRQLIQTVEVINRNLLKITYQDGFVHEQEVETAVRQNKVGVAI